MNTHNLEKSLNHALFHKSYSLKKTPNTNKTINLHIPQNR